LLLPFFYSISTKNCRFFYFYSTTTHAWARLGRFNFSRSLLLLQIRSLLCTTVYYIVFVRKTLVLLLFPCDALNRFLSRNATSVFIATQFSANKIECKSASILPRTSRYTVKIYRQAVYLASIVEICSVYAFLL